MPQGAFDSDEIKRHSALTQQRATDLENAIAELRSAASQLAQVWTGTGASAFETARGNWEAAVKPMQESLEGIAKTLGQTSDIYASNETSIAQAFD
jgi:WXG100 family type VII secretion target